jgi:hypothetical protein
VFVIDGGIARRRMVQVGQRNGLVAEITSGLAHYASGRYGRGRVHRSEAVVMT